MSTQETLSGLLTMDELRSWATGKPTGAKVGIPESAEYCPIAQYLDENTDDHWGVDNGQAFINWGCHERDYTPLPVWTMRIVHLVDGLSGLRVTREQFLQILDEVAIEGDELKGGSHG